MAKYSNEMIQYLLRRLDPLDVLEFIDYHPESIQRSPEEVTSWCPLCQDQSGRYLKINLATKEFDSRPPNGPDQSGNLVDLYARSKRMDYDSALESLAEEFSVPLLAGDFQEQLTSISKTAEANLELANDSSKRDVAIRLAEEGFRRILQFEPKNLRAWRGIFLVNILRREHGPLATAANRLIELMGDTEDFDGQQEVASQYLQIFPADMTMRERLARLYADHGLKEKAAHEFMTIADIAESAEQFDKAIACYREIQRRKLESVDVLPMLISLLLAQGKNSEAKAEVHREIVRLKESGDYLHAAEVAAKILEIDPADDGARLQIVELAIGAGLDSGGRPLALAAVNELIALDHREPAMEALANLSAESPDDTLILEMLITLNRASGEQDLAEDLELRLADLYQAQGKLDAASDILTRMVRDNEQNILSLKSLANLLLTQKRNPEAVEYLRRIAEIEIGNKQHAAALATVRRALAIDPHLWDLREREIQLLFETDANDNAREKVKSLSAELQKEDLPKRLSQILDHVVEWDPSDSESRLLLSALYEQLGQTEKSDDVRKKLILDLVEQGDAEVAEEAVQKLLESNETNRKLRGELADIYLRQESKIAQAKTIYEALEREFADEQQNHERREVLEKLHRLDPKNVQLLAQLASVHTVLEDKPGLFKVLLRQLKLARENSEPELAAKHAEAILDIEPDHIEALRNIIELQATHADPRAGRKNALRLAAALHKNGAYEEEEAFLTDALKNYAADIQLLEKSVDALRHIGSEEAMLHRIDQLLALNSYSSEKKIRLVRDVIRDHPQMMELQRRLTRLLRSAGRIDELVTDINLSIKTHQEAGHTVEVVDLYEQLLEAEPDNIEARETLLKLLKNTGQESRFVPHMIGLARAYHKARRLEEATEAFNLVLEIDLENEEAYRGVANVLRDRNENEDAAQRLRELAALHVRRNSPVEAVKVLREVSELDSTDQEVRREIIALNRELGDLDDAAEELGSLADLLRDEGDVEGAIAARREAVQLQPDSVDIHRALATELKTAGRDDEAQDESIRLTQKLTKSQNYEHALALLDEMIAADDENLIVRRARAHFFDETGDEKRALQEYRELEKLGQRMSTTIVQKMDSRQVRLHEELEEEIGLELLPEYDFDSFVVGARNKFAHATAKAVADHPGSARNPLFLYSGVGLGKTHLMHAIANQMLKNNTRCRVVYTSTEYFTTALEHAREKNLLSEFRARHRQTDVLLLDDIQFLAGREESQEEFFHIFNMLHQSRKQIVVTSDRPPKDIARLDMRLRTRFGQGVIVDIQSPDLETRLVILRAEAQRRAFKVPDDALNVIAHKITTNIRELKGAFNLFLEHHEIGGEPLDAATAKEIVDKYYTT